MGTASITVTRTVRYTIRRRQLLSLKVLSPGLIHDFFLNKFSYGFLVSFVWVYDCGINL